MTLFVQVVIAWQPVRKRSGKGKDGMRLSGLNLQRRHKIRQADCKEAVFMVFISLDPPLSSLLYCDKEVSF